MIEMLERVVARLRRQWPGMAILVRADSAYAREELLAWCEANGVNYAIGVARNAWLTARIGRELALAEEAARRRGRPARRFAEFRYATRTNWSHKRRVIAKAEHLPGKANPRFVVTSLPGTVSARTVYERVYCPRGRMENGIKDAAARSVVRPDLRLPLPRQPAPAPLLRVRLDPLRGAAPRAERHPAGPRHRRYPAAQAASRSGPG